jgi:hypothetical protein
MRLIMCVSASISISMAFLGFLVAAARWHSLLGCFVAKNPLTPTQEVI